MKEPICLERFENFNEEGDQPSTLLLISCTLNQQQQHVTPLDLVVHGETVIQTYTV